MLCSKSSVGVGDGTCPTAVGWSAGGQMSAAETPENECGSDAFLRSSTGVLGGALVADDLFSLSDMFDLKRTGLLSGFCCG